MSPNEKGPQRGFTLIEAIVALVIMASALTGLYTWVNTGLISLRRAEAVSVTAVVVEEALQKIELLPLRSQTSGTFTLGRYEVSWRARLVEPGLSTTSELGAPGLYDLSLFDVDFGVSRGSTRLGEWSVRQLRHDQARVLSYD